MHLGQSGKRRWIEAGGWLGTVGILGTYAAISMGNLSPKSGIYQGINILSAIAIAAHSHTRRAFPSVVINVVWAIIGGLALCNLLR